MFRQNYLFSTALIATAATLIPAGSAHAKTYSFSVPAQPASSSIPRFAKQAGIQILISAPLTSGVRTNALFGNYDARHGLEMLLRGSGLRVSSWEGTVVTLDRGQAVKREAPASEDARNVGSEEIVVTGVTAPFRSKDNSTTIVETAVFDDIETMASDGSIASMLVQLPGISTEEDADQPRYITVRGISADLNHTTIDGLTIATVGESGSGTRRTNLQLIPSDLSVRTDLTKTFTAEQDAGAIGGAINIVTRSAFDRSQRNFFVDAYGIYSTFGGEKGSNAGGDSRRHWGAGLKANFANRFGADREFGIVLSGRYEDRVRNGAKRWQDNKMFFDGAGKNLSAPDAGLGWNGLVAPGNHGYGSYTNILKSYGGSAKLEWQPADGSAYASIVGYDYFRRESSTMNSNWVDAAKWVGDQTPEGGRQRITYITENWRHNQWKRENRGVLTNFNWNFDSSQLAVRSGLTEETYDDWEPYLGGRAQPRDQYLTYASTDLPQLVSIDRPEIIHDSEYLMRTQREAWHAAKQRIFDARIDYSYNVGRQARGFGFVTGAEWRRLTLDKDVESLNYRASGRANDYLYDPGFKPIGSNYSFAWFNYEKYRAQRWDNVPLDPAASAYSSGAADYRFREDTAAAYASLHYNLANTTIVAGLRYDDVRFVAHTPLIEEGALTGQIARNEGGYDNFLPSLNIVQRFGEDTNLRLSYSRTLGRPTPGNLATAQSLSCGDNEEGGADCTITRGNAKLQPRRSRNLDLTVEHYFNGNNGMILLGYFRKDIKDDIFTLRTEEIIDGDLYLIRQPVNAAKSSIQGIEFAYVNRGIPIGDHIVDASFNAAYMMGEMNYVSDGASRKLDRLVSQPDLIGNASLTYRIPEIGGAARVNVNYRSEFVSSIGATPWQDRANDDLTMVNLALWHKVTDNITFKYEWNNVFDAQPRYLMGENLEWTRQIDDYGSALFFHVIFDL